jgi:hypothetical protein
LCVFIHEYLKIMKKSLCIALFLCYCMFIHAQKFDLFHTKHNFPQNIRLHSDTDITFNRSRFATNETPSEPELKIGGYISSYFANNDDDNLYNGFVLFPTLEPRKDEFSLNMALISLAYKNKNMRGNIILHYGDVPESSWPKTFNLIQEANGGFRLIKNVWLDVGFFKTHIGIESFQPRENIASSMSVMNFYDPYFLSGAKLSYLVNSKLTLQACVFNGYNEYLDNNRNKALAFTTIYNPTSHLSLTYNFLTCDESPDDTKTKHQRYYNNFYSTLTYDKIVIGMDVNYGIQQNSLKSDSLKPASLWGALLVAKYRFLKKLWAYGRVENFSDPNQILTGNLDIGNYIRGTTLGIDFTPQKTVSLSAEWRILESDNLIFKRGNKLVNRRNEFNLCLDLWF